jgi:hypothetical protein
MAHRSSLLDQSNKEGPLLAKVAETLKAVAASSSSAVAAAAAVIPEAQATDSGAPGLQPLSKASNAESKMAD